jgi:hypothetical protein
MIWRVIGGEGAILGEGKSIKLKHNKQRKKATKMAR